MQQRYADCVQVEPNPDWLKVGRRVRKAREAVGMSQTELMQAVSWARSYQLIGQVEKGTRELKPFEAAEIEWVCNADRGYLLTGEGYLHGGVPNLNPPTAMEMDLLKRVGDLERELGALRQTVAIAEKEATAALALARRVQREIEPPQSDTG